jgi:DNA-binding MarR family transcriptional regulator
MPKSSSPAAAELDTAGVEQLLGYLLALARLGTQRSFVAHVGGPFALRPVDFTLLLLLRDNPPCLPKQIGSCLHLQPPHVTTLVDRLAARGLLLRTPDPQDGRAVRVALTGIGQALAQQLAQASRTMDDTLLAALTADERQQLRALLRKLVHADGNRPSLPPRVRAG